VSAHLVLDTSAVLAIVFDEPERTRFIDIMGSAESLHMCAFSALEAQIVVRARRGAAAGVQLTALLHELGVCLEPFTPAQAALAADAWQRFGKGRHAAGLNIGDCAAYALAVDTMTPLLFKGQDFAQTDVPCLAGVEVPRSEGP
jgi:ribonuclease VapC